MLVRAIERAGYTPGDDIAHLARHRRVGVRRDGRYRLGLEGREFDSDGLCELLLGWIDRYPIVSIEDPLAEDDAEGMPRFTAAVGDTRADHRRRFPGHQRRAGRAAPRAQGACNAVLIKPNQAGTITETKAALDAGRRAGLGTIVSARSGETEDVTIVHLAVGWDAGQLKVGSFARSERMAKWNEVLRIEEALGTHSLPARVRRTRRACRLSSRRSAAHRRRMSVTIHPRLLRGILLIMLAVFLFSCDGYAREVHAASRIRCRR